MKRFLAQAAAVLALAGLSAPALAQSAPSVVASIKPIHSLVASVMEGVGEPKLLVRGGASPHTYSMRTSDAAALQDADLVVWVGPNLEAFLDDAIDTLGTDAATLALADAPGLTKLDIRTGGTFEAHTHDGEDGHEDEHAHAGEHGDDHAHEDEHARDDDHAHEHAHDEEAEHDHEGEHAEDAHAHEHETGHDHGTADMHLWLDPENARVMVSAIEAALAEVDPANAEAYAENAEATRAALDELTSDVGEQLAPVAGTPFIVFHDAYHYFENRFGVQAAGSITVSPEVIPGAQRISEIKDKVSELGATCVFAEPQFEPRLIGVVTEGTEARSGELDPLGAALDEGPELYFELIGNMAQSMETCLQG